MNSCEALKISPSKFVPSSSVGLFFTFIHVALEECAKTERLLPTTGIDRIKVHQVGLLSLRLTLFQHSALLKRFQKVMEEYNQSQLEYRDKCKSRLKLQLQVAGADITDSKVDDMLDSTNPCVFTDAVSRSIVQLTV